MFKAATLNANSVRARLPIILGWLGKHAPDVLALQETKVRDEEFPAGEFRAAGYHVIFRGEKSYNGVAILSRQEPADVAFGLDDGGPPDEARLVRAKIGGVHIVNTYVPQGTAVDDPRFAYKLEWFGRLRALFERFYTPRMRLLWTGDFNVAPEEIDVYDPKMLAGSVCFRGEEREALKAVMSWGFVDVFRKHNREGGQYTFWDYRLRGGVKKNLGWRLDHLMATKPLVAKSTAAYIDREPRLMERPSDHTFLVAEFDV